MADWDDRIFFVGMHNKTGMKPLDSQTRSGKTVDDIIRRTMLECIKTNLSELDYLPLDKVILDAQVSLWHEKYQPKQDDVIVLLGRWVHQKFDRRNLKNIIKLPHPAAFNVFPNRIDYVNNAMKEILNIQQSH